MTEQNNIPDLMELFHRVSNEKPELSEEAQLIRQLNAAVLKTLRDAGFEVTNTELAGRNSAEMVLKKDAIQKTFVLSVVPSNPGSVDVSKFIGHCEVEGKRIPGRFPVRENTAHEVAKFMVTKLAELNQTPREPII